MADMTSGLIGFAVSTSLIVIFGEIIPQALCTRYGLMIGAYTICFVQIIKLLLYIIVKPLSMLLNKILGQEIRSFYNKIQVPIYIYYIYIYIYTDEDNAKAIRGRTSDR